MPLGEFHSRFSAPVPQDKRETDEADEKRLMQLLTNWCEINFSEAYMMMMHLKSVSENIKLLKHLIKTTLSF